MVLYFRRISGVRSGWERMEKSRAFIRSIISAMVAATARKRPHPISPREGPAHEPPPLGAYWYATKFQCPTQISPLLWTLSSSLPEIVLSLGEEYIPLVIWLFLFRYESLFSYETLEERGNIYVSLNLWYLRQCLEKIPTLRVGRNLRDDSIHFI